jgi:hypothetical protein
MSESPSFTCPDCGRKNRHPEDIRNSYCAQCHAFKKDRIVRRCLICEKIIVMSSLGHSETPLDAVVIRIDGNFGSRVYDPYLEDRPTEHLRAYVCDPCLEKKGDDGLVEMVQTAPQPPKVRALSWRTGKHFA